MNDLRRDLLRRVRDNLCDGSSHLARIALESIIDYAEVDPDDVEADDVEALRTELVGFADDLMQARPNMSAIRHLVGRWREGIEAFEGDVPALREYAREHAASVRDWANVATEATVRCGVDRIGEYRTLLTHSMSSTVTKVLKQLPGRDFDVITTESRPRLEGWQLASILGEEGIPVTYITDAQLGIFVEQADAVVVGADSILADGSFINKVGTRLLALGAREAGVPLFVCAESFKCTVQEAADVQLEEKPAKELKPPHVPGIRARNVYFEIVPAALVTDWLSDEQLSERFGR